MIPSRARRASKATGLVIRPRIGLDWLPEWSPTAPAAGWDLETTRAAAMDYADQHPVEGRRHRAVAVAAWRALAHAIDEANGVRVSNPRSLIRADLEPSAATEAASQRWPFDH